MGTDPPGKIGMGGGGSLFEQFFGSPGGGTTTRTTSTRRNRARKGADITTSVEIELEDAYHGVEKLVTITRSEPCPTCEGRGYPSAAEVETCSKCSGRGHITHLMDTSLGRSKRRKSCDRCQGTGEVYAEACGRCGGDGQVRQETTLPVDIPAGIESGQTVRLRAEGQAGERGGSAGDLLVDVNVAEHPRFDRDSADLYRRHALSFPQAALGDTIQIPTFVDPVELQIPSGTQSGETFRLADEGMPYYQQPGQGDLYVQTGVVTPENLTHEQRLALRAFADATNSEGDPL